MDAIKAPPTLNTPAHIKAYLLTVCAQIPGIVTVLEDPPEVAFLQEVLPALVVSEGRAVNTITDRAKSVFDMTREYTFALYVTPCAPDTDSVDRLRHLSPFLLDVPAFFATGPRRRLGELAVSTTLPNDSGNELAVIEDTTYIYTTFTMSITTRHKA